MRSGDAREAIESIAKCTRSIGERKGVVAAVSQRLDICLIQIHDMFYLYLRQVGSLEA